MDALNRSQNFGVFLMLPAAIFFFVQQTVGFRPTPSGITSVRVAAEIFCESKFEGPSEKVGSILNQHATSKFGCVDFYTFRKVTHLNPWHMPGFAATTPPTKEPNRSENTFAGYLFSASVNRSNEPFRTRHPGKGKEVLGRENDFLFFHSTVSYLPGPPRLRRLVFVFPATNAHRKKISKV